ncbi:uncharacterized protein LOC118449144 [Vespa mandarinia]|uniref:uncharacterized protein LOC118449144 n=1 Tax=Vespa mandarinia TaxID=7446 RepID=UPI00161DABDB|nr:uncharacterized protein LOC118449144 [Vespa mandarinia]
MSRHLRNINLLGKINNIDEDCSENNQEVSDIDNNTEENNYDLFDSDTDEENILNIRRGQKRKRFIVSSESENEEEIGIATDGTVRQKIKKGFNRGRTPIYNIFKEISGSARYAKRNIIKGRVESTFSLIIDHNMIKHVRKYMELEAIRVLKTKWNLSIAKLYAFIGLLFARGAYEIKIWINHIYRTRNGVRHFS